ncbi:MAG: acyltransferase family protein [Planctomycetota bacterium]
MSEPSLNSGTRLHALDGLRATMMLLGLVLHSACNYQSTPADAAWSFRDSQTHEFFTILVSFVHVWRMPIFMFISGFFSSLLVERRGIDNFLSNRVSRLGIPFVIFLPLILPMTTSGFYFANVFRFAGSTAAGFDNYSLTMAGNLFPPITIHLWFVYYLLLYCLISFMLIQLGRQLLSEKIRLLPAKIIGAVMTAPGGTILLCIPLAFTLQKTAGLLMTGITFIPELSAFTSYGFLFFCGWMFWSQRSHLESLRSWPKAIASIVLTILLYPIWIDFFLQWIGEPAGEFTKTLCQILSVESLQRSTILWLGASVSALMIWNAIWGFLGLFLLTTDRNIPFIRYFVDGSYWVYIIHLPLTIWIPGLIANTELGVFSKFSITLLSTTVIGFVTYDLFVRSTFIGAILNGRRWPRALGKAIFNRPLELHEKP